MKPPTRNNPCDLTVDCIQQIGKNCPSLSKSIANVIEATWPVNLYEYRKQRESLYGWIYSYTGFIQSSPEKPKP